MDRGRASPRLFRASVGDAEPRGLDVPGNGRRDASEALTPGNRRIDSFDRAHHRVAALCLGVKAGLMVSHAAALCARTAPPSASPQRGCPSSPRSPPWGACWAGGRAIDRASAPRRCPRRAGRWRPALAWAAAARSSVVAAQTALAAASFAYGVLASAVPGGSTTRWTSRFPRVRFVYTAWGLAGLAAPALAGVLFDARGSYTAALTVATALSLGSAVVAATLRPGRSHEEWAAAIAEAKAREGAGGEDDDERTSSSDGDPTSESRSEPVAPAGA